MSTPNSPAARLLGYRIRLTYVGVFCLLVIAAILALRVLVLVFRPDTR